MAYNPYQMTGYLPYATPLPSSQTYNLPAQQSNNGSLMTVLVESEQEVNDYPVAAGLTVQLISFSLGKFWLKSTATNGVPMPLRVFHFTEEESKTNNQNNLVSRDEFVALSEKLDKLVKELGGDK